MTRCLLVILAAFGTTLSAQWLNHPAPGIPRLPDGKPNLSAPAPRLPDGKPDLSGLWTSDKSPTPLMPEPLLDIKPDDVVLTVEGEARQRQPRENAFPGAQCLPNNLPQRTAVAPFKILVLKAMVVVLYEDATNFRQIFLDGRALPRDPNPTWMGYSIGKWDGDTLVVETSGFNEQPSIVPGSRPHSDALRIIERYRRRDFGHLEIQFTVEDSKVYTKPWSFRETHHLIPDSELLEYVCNENEKDLKHMVGRSK